MMKYTQVPTDAFEHLQMNAGILVDEFDPETGVIGNILGATSGGITFASNPQYSDLGEGIDNIRPNTAELKRLDGYDPSMSGTFLTCTSASVAMLTGAADVDKGDSTHVIPREELVENDFKDIWSIGDYSDKNTGANAGFLAIHLKRSLNTSGFGIKTNDKGKGEMAFDFHGHYTLKDQADIPFEYFVKAGT